MTVATKQLPSYPTDSGSAYPSNIDGSLMVTGEVAGAFAPHQVPPAPGTPVLSYTPGGNLGGATYYVKTTYNTPSGSTVPSSEANLSVPANNLLVITSPANAGGVAGVTGWDMYVSTSAANETRQNGNGASYALGTNWTEPGSGLVAGTAVPAGISKLNALVDPGRMFVSGAIVSQGQQSISGFVATGANSRIDRIVLDSLTGVATRIAGAENVAPVAPAIPAGKLPIAQVGPFSNGTLQTTNSMITDERTMLIPPVGKHTVYIPSGAMIVNTSNGATVSSPLETANNKVMVGALDFPDGSVAKYVQFSMDMPKDWDVGTFTAKYNWMSASGSGDVVWQIRALALSDGDTLDTAFGTTVKVTDTAANNTERMTSDTAAITPSNSPAARDRITFQVFRDPTDGSDTFTGTARLIGVEITYRANSVDSA